MAVQEAMIAWGYRFAATSYALRVNANAAGAETCTFNSAAAGNLDVNADYFMGGTGQAADILYLLKLCIEKHTAGITVDVYLDSNQKVKIDLVAGTSFEILWADSNTTLDPTLFGFAPVDSGAVTTLTGSEVPRGLWVPGRPITSDGKPRDQLVGGVSVALSGKPRVSDFGTAEKTRSLFWSLLQKSVVRNEYAEVPYLSFQHAWTTSIGKGRAFRYYPDDQSLAVTAKSTYYTKSKDDPMSRSGPFELRWDVRLECNEDSSQDWSASVYSLDCEAGSRSATAPNVISGDSTWSMAFWILRDGTIGTTDSLIGQWAASERCFFLKTEASASEDKLRMLFADDPDSPTTIHWTSDAVVITAANKANWHHIACTFNAGTFALYFDGKAVAGSVTSGSIPSAMTGNASAVGIGQDGGGTGADSVSHFDDLCFYNKALSAYEVKLLYDGKPTDIQGLTRWWGFERDAADHVTGARITPNATNPATYSTSVRS